MKLERTDQKRRDQLLPLEAHVLKQLQFTDYAAKFIEYGKCSCAVFDPKFSKKIFYFFSKRPVISCTCYGPSRQVYK